MELSTARLVLASDAAIDLQMHTTSSDGTWTPEELIDYLISEQFGLVAITDHDRVDTAFTLQQLARQKQLPMLVAVEMSTTWKGALTDVLCYGFDPEHNELQSLTQSIAHRQRENTREVYENLCKQGYLSPDSSSLQTLVEKPGAQQPHEIARLLRKQQGKKEMPPVGDLLDRAGFFWTTTEIAEVVKATHKSGAVSLIAHPGRGNGYTVYDEMLLDELRREVPIDGLEVYYPAHKPEQIAAYLSYASKHHLLISSGSDSHGPEKKPIKYQADLSQRLLERLGIQIKH